MTPRNERRKNGPSQQKQSHKLKSVSISLTHLKSIWFHVYEFLQASKIFEFVGI